MKLANKQFLFSFYFFKPISQIPNLLIKILHKVKDILTCPSEHTPQDNVTLQSHFFFCNYSNLTQQKAIKIPKK